MSMEAFNWNVVVAGYWNPAILTPSGIGQRLFGLDKGTPVLVEVPIDGGILPYRVRHADLTVTAEMTKLVIEADQPNYEILERAKTTAVKAIVSLPETPFTAAGFNIRWKILDPLPAGLIERIKCSLDDSLSDASFEIKSRSLRRTLKKDAGLINLDILLSEESKIEFNFHRQSSKNDELIAWLSFPIAQVETIIQDVFDKVVNL